MKIIKFCKKCWGFKRHIGHGVRHNKIGELVPFSDVGCPRCDMKTLRQKSGTFYIKDELIMNNENEDYQILSEKQIAEKFNLKRGDEVNFIGKDSKLRGHLLCMFEKVPFNYKTGDDTRSGEYRCIVQQRGDTGIVHVKAAFLEKNRGWDE